MKWRALVALAVLWWLLSAGSWQAWVLGVPSVLLAWLAYRQLRGKRHTFNVAWLGVAQFIPYFLWQSLRGGLDVAWRVWLPRVPVEPHFLTYPLQLPAGTARAVFVYTVGLLPGTLSVEMQEGQLLIHALNPSVEAHAELAALEQRIAALFALSLGGET